VEINWQRIAADLRTTANIDMTLVITPDPEQECWPLGTLWLTIDVLLDGTLSGTLGRGFAEGDDEAALAYLAELLREDFLDEEVWGGWPICPLHNTHPLEPTTDTDGNATWQCPGGPAVARIGDLSRSA
jgi:hypothetical protein